MGSLAIPQLVAAYGVIEALVSSAALVIVVSFLTTVLSVVFGAALAYRAKPTWLYGVCLALLFFPFALGSSVWAFSVSRLTDWIALQSELVSGGTLERAASLLIFSLARIVPLGAFFVAISLQRYTSDIRPYIQVYKITFPFFLTCSLKRIPGSIILLLGLFAGALMASEAALATFLYRANPGTQPETMNIFLSRLFRESYASGGPETLVQIAVFGMVVSVGMLFSALTGAAAGRAILAALHHCLMRQVAAGKHFGAFVSMAAHLGLAINLIPGILAATGLFLVPRKFSNIEQTSTLQVLSGYREIIFVGASASLIIIALSVAIAIKLRYGKRNMLAWFEGSSLAACILILPAFIPVLSIVAVLGVISNDVLQGPAGYFALIVSQIGLHYSVFQFICIALIAAVPEKRVFWQRASQMRFGFSFMIDGIQHHRPILIGLVGLCLVEIATGGTISRWFSHLVKAPEEALYAAAFGRLANANEVLIISWSVSVVAIGVCGILAIAHVRDLSKRLRHG